MASRRSDLEFLIPQTSGIGDIVSAITEKVKENELNILKLLYEKGEEEKQRMRESLSNLAYVDALSSVTIKEENVDEKGNVVIKEKPLLGAETLKSLANVALYMPQKDFLTMIDNLTERLIRQGIATGEQITQLKRIQEDARLRQQQRKINEMYQMGLLRLGKERLELSEMDIMLDFIADLQRGVTSDILVNLLLTRDLYNQYQLPQQQGKFPQKSKQPQQQQQGKQPQQQNQNPFVDTLKGNILGSSGYSPFPQDISSQLPDISPEDILEYMKGAEKIIENIKIAKERFKKEKKQAGIGG